MKHVHAFIIPLFLGIFAISCQQNNTNKNENVSTEETSTEPGGGIITFDEPSHDFGKLTSGEVVSYIFYFTNTGTENLIVEEVRPSCGCTSPSYTKTPVAPNEKGQIEVKFDSSGFSGMQNKSVTVTTNGQPEKTVLHFSATVEVE